MKKKLVFTLLVCVIVLNFISCSNIGYQLEYYKITSEIYNNRPTGVSNEEALSYVKNASGTKYYSTSWHSNYNNLEKELNDITESYTNIISKETKSKIMEQSTTALYFKPGLLHPNNNYWFFYIVNNEY